MSVLTLIADEIVPIGLPLIDYKLVSVHATSIAGEIVPISFRPNRKIKRQDLTEMIPSEIKNYTPPPSRCGILRGHGGGVTGFCHNKPLKMHLSCVSWREWTK